VARRPKNENHPLTRLRKLLSKETDVTREIFAERVHIPPASIKAIETGVYDLSRHVASKITMATGVSTWSLLEDEDPLCDVFGRRYSVDSYRQFQLLREHETVTKMTDAHALCLRVLGLLRTVDNKRFNQLFLRIYLDLEEIWKQYGLVHAGKEFHATQFGLELVEDPKKGDRMRKTYPFDGSRLLNFSKDYFEAFSDQNEKDYREKAGKSSAKRSKG